MELDYKALKDSGFMRQKQKNRFSMRLRVVGGHLTADQLEAIAAAARKYGDGYVHLTSRQGVEIPFIKPEEIEQVKSALREGGVSTGACGPQMRTVTACQGGAVCPSGCIDTFPLAKELSDRYYGKPLPHKFKIGVTGCRNNCLKSEENDFGIKGGMRVEWREEACLLCGACARACRSGAIAVEEGRVALDRESCKNCGRCVKACPVQALEGKSGYLLTFGGMFGNTIAEGRPLVHFIEEEETLLRVADAVLAFFAKHGRPGERLKFTADRVGWDRLQQIVEEACEGVAVNI